MSPVRWIRTSLETYVRYCTALDSQWVLAAMTLLAMVRYQQGAWFFHVLGPVALGIACLFPQVVNREQFWLPVCLLCGSSIVLDWVLLGNHAFVLFYWTLALLLGCLVADRPRFLARAARWIVTAVFLFACIWKVHSSDFRSGATMRYLLSATVPMGQVAVVFTELTGAELAHNVTSVEQVLASRIPAQTVLTVPSGVTLLADALTHLTQMVEGLVALIFLLPLSRQWRWLREASLLTFMLTAYTLIPVAAFATQLAYLGYAVTASHRFRAAFIALFFGFQLTDLALGGVWGAA